MEPAAGSDKSPTVGEPCPVCRGDGVLRWQQPNADGTELTEMEHPCPHGCSGWWKLPAAERGRVVEQDDNTPARARDSDSERDVLPLDMLRDAMTRWGHGPGDRPT